MDKLLEQKFERVDEKIDTHEIRLNNHSSRIASLEMGQSKFEAKMEGLIKQLEALTTTMRWFIGAIVGMLISIFVYAIQQGLVK